jgi:transposase InsO family protein
VVRLGVMARKVTPMHTRVVVAVARAVGELDQGLKVNVTALSADLGVSPKTFYKWANRYRESGLDGLAELSRRPRRSPGRISPMIEDAIVEWRKRLVEEGLDHGPATIRWHLSDGGRIRPPSEATIWRVLVRRGFVVPQPQKRPKCSFRRFEAPAPNEWWQIDATEWTLAGGTTVSIINVLDDHSRVAVESLAMAATTTELAWQAFCNGAQRFGLPRGCLSDNGLIFSGKLRGFEVFFEVQLRAAGVRPITSRPYHPQTCGKVERFQQTLKKWLRKHPTETLEELQAALDTFRDYYNHERPHRGIGRITPWQRWSANTPASAPVGALDAPVVRRHVTVSGDGTLQGARWRIHVGREHIGRAATIILRGTHTTVFVEGRLVRDFELDPTRYHQPQDPHPRQRVTTVTPNGTVTAGSWIVQVGSRHAGQAATVIVDATHVQVLIDDQLIRELHVDPTRRYQPLGPSQP